MFVSSIVLESKFHSKYVLHFYSLDIISDHWLYDDPVTIVSYEMILLNVCGESLGKRLICASNVNHIFTSSLDTNNRI